jgi:sugar/nucleoside kinase (ribokinase family)
MILGCGSVVVDVLKKVPLFTVGDKTKIIDQGTSSKTLIAGGVTLNNLVWSKMAGVPSGVFGRLGNDEYGKFLLSEMDRFGVNHDNLEPIDGEEAAYTDFFLDPQPERTLFMYFGTTATTTPEYIREKCSDAIRNAAYVVTEISQLPLDTVLEIERIANEAGVPVAVDLDIAPSNGIMEYIGTADQYEEVARNATLLKPCDAAATELTGTDDLEQAIQKLHADYGKHKLVAITAAADGSLLYDGKNLHWVPVLELGKVEKKLVDPCGAGDAYFGGLNAAIMKLGFDAPLEDLGTLANATAGLCCSTEGAFPVDPKSPGAELQKLIASARGTDTAKRLLA